MFLSPHHLETNLTNTIFNILSNLPGLKNLDPTRIPRNSPLPSNPMYLCPKLPIQSMSSSHIPPISPIPSLNPSCPPPSPNERMDPFLGLIYFYQVGKLVFKKSLFFVQYSVLTFISYMGPLHLRRRR